MNQPNRVHPPGVVIPLDWQPLFEEMGHEQAGQMLMAILTYSATGALPEFSDRELQLIWRIVQSRLDNNRERYCRKVERSRAHQQRPAAQPSTKRTPPTRAQCEAAVDKWL